MKLLAYTINGQTIGIDIEVWNDTILSGNTAFLAIEDGGTIPTDYVDISSVSNWDNFGGSTTATTATIKEEIIKLIPNQPTAEEYQILEGYMNVGINQMTNIDNNITLGTVLTDGYLSNITDTKFNISGGALSGAISGSSGQLDVAGKLNVAGDANVAGLLETAGDLKVAGTIDNPALNNMVTGGTNLGTGEPIYHEAAGPTIQLKSFIGGTNVTLSSNADEITISASGGGTPVWGDITGTLSDQTDLQNALDAKLNTTLFSTYTGTTAPATFASKNDAITGATNVGTGEGLYTGTTANELQVKSLVAGIDVILSSDANSITINATGGGTGGTITTYSTIDGGGVTTTSPTDVLMDNMQINSVPAGNYFLSFGTSLNHSSNGASIDTTIYVDGNPVANSGQHWQRGNAQGNVYGTHNYSGFPITVDITSTVEIRWLTSAATATSTNRYLSLIKVG